MSLKITIKVDGQTEQQLAPLVGQIAAHSHQWLAVEAQEKPPSEVSSSAEDLRMAYHNHSALLQQQIQQLMAQTRQLQAQLAGAPTAKALSQAADPVQATSDEFFSKDSKPPASEPPTLPAQYQMHRRQFAAWRLGRSLSRMPAQLWRSLLWRLPKKERLLLFLLMCGCTYALFAVIPMLIEQLWPAPEFVESDGNGPGSTAPPEDNEVGQAEDASPPARSTPVSPASKSGSHPPPPPAFQRP